MIKRFKTMTHLSKFQQEILNRKENNFVAMNYDASKVFRAFYLIQNG